MAIESFQIVQTSPHLYIIVSNDDGSSFGQILELPSSLETEKAVVQYVADFFEKYEKDQLPKTPPDLSSVSGKPIPSRPSKLHEWENGAWTIPVALP
jgi:hypothetical protein